LKHSATFGPASFSYAAQTIIRLEPNSSSGGAEPENLHSTFEGEFPHFCLQGTRQASGYSLGKLYLLPQLAPHN